MQTIVLWDIDNTLLYTGGAGSLGMARAFQDLYGVPDDRLATEIDRFCDAYVPHLDAALGEVAGGRLMPGITEILEALSQRADVRMGLGTGNFRRGGELKLRHFGIDGYFPGTPGGFGEDSESRDTVIRIGIERLTNGGRPDRVVIIGDTPHDVTAARANGAFALAVATGRNDVEELAACGADVAVADLSDVASALRIICGD